MIAYVTWLGVFTLLPTVTLDGRAWCLPASHRLCLAVGQWAFFALVPPPADARDTPSWSGRLLLAGLPFSLASTVLAGLPWRTAWAAELAVAVVALSLAGLRGLSAAGRASGRWALPCILLIFGAAPLAEFLTRAFFGLRDAGVAGWSPVAVLAAALRPGASLWPLGALALVAAVLQAVLQGLGAAFRKAEKPPVPPTGAAHA